MFFKITIENNKRLARRKGYFVRPSADIGKGYRCESEMQLVKYVYIPFNWINISGQNEAQQIIFLNPSCQTSFILSSGDMNMIAGSFL